MRVAIYYAPEPDDPLHVAGSQWLGRDAGGGRCLQPALPDIAAVTADASRYGFHATLKPPMRLIDGIGLDAVLTQAEALAKTLTGFALPRLAVADLHGFLALRETEPSVELQSLADACVAWLDELRAPADAADIARRRASKLSAPRDANLQRWGYPDVFATWQFHMTISRRLSDAERPFWQQAASIHFAPSLTHRRVVRELTVFVENEPGGEFQIVRRIPFGG